MRASFPPEPIRIASFMYHEVTDDPAASGFQRQAARPYRLSTKAFLRHLDRFGVGPNPPELVSELDLARPGDHVVLTFDDGGLSARYVADRLLERGWRGHFFIVTARLGERTFLAPEDVRAIGRAGHLIGSHSHTHPDIIRNSPRPQLLEEWRVSRMIIENLLGEPCFAASVPGGDVSPAVVETAAQMGFRYVFTSEPVVRPVRVASCWVLGRIPIRIGCLPATIDGLIRFRGWRRARLARSVKDLFRRGFPRVYGAYVRHATRPELVAPNAEGATDDARV